MILNAYILAYQLKMILNAKTKLFKNRKVGYDSKTNCYIIKILLFF